MGYASVWRSPLVSTRPSHLCSQPCEYQEIPPDSKLRGVGNIPTKSRRKYSSASSAQLGKMSTSLVPRLAERLRTYSRLAADQLAETTTSQEATEVGGDPSRPSCSRALLTAASPFRSAFSLSKKLIDKERSFAGSWM